MPSPHRSACALLLLSALVVSMTTTTAHAAKLRVISYNVWGVPSIAPEREARINEIAKRLAAMDPDIVALQEVWEDDDAARLAPVLAEAGLTEQRHFGKRQVGGRGSGLWMASRHPIVGEHFEEFDVGHKPYIHWHLDYLSSKGVALLDIQTTAGVVTVANTHFQSTYTFGDYTFIQLAQSLVVARATKALTTPLVLVGDINAKPDSIVSRALMAKVGLTPASRDFGIDIIATRPSALGELRVDAFEQLFEDLVVFDDGRTRTLSDHPCLRADITLAPCKACVRPSTWPDTQASVQRFLTNNVDDTHLFITITRTASVVLLLGCVLFVRAARQRRLSRSWLTGGVGLVAALLLLAGWLAYVGWSYGPYKLDVLAKLRDLMA